LKDCAIYKEAKQSVLSVGENTFLTPTSYHQKSGEKTVKGNKKRYGMARRVLGVFILFCVFAFSGCDEAQDGEIVLRVANWEEYMDEGGWNQDDEITFSDGSTLCPENSLVKDFEDWYLETYGKKVRVEYSTFGTNEELYNQITIGDVYDLVCPSEYMIMKMMKEKMLVPYSENFLDPKKEENAYIRGVSPYIAQTYDKLSFDGEKLNKYAAGYMWGTLGIVYNPEEVSEAEASTWKLLLNEKYAKRVTIKDSVRDAFFAGVSISQYETIMDDGFRQNDNYADAMYEKLNVTDCETVDSVEEILSRIKRNVYSFETDSGKADLVTGKVVANQQWSGDAVFTMNQAEEDGVLLCYCAPEESTNLWFDGWVMLQKGISEDPSKQQVAEAFVNYISMPENAVRNMYYIGYTSVISGGESDKILDYVNLCYEADPEQAPEEELVDYDISYFFGTPDAVITTTEDQTKRQLFAQYPPEDVMKRSVIMACFDAEGNERINRMWTNVRCFDIENWWNTFTGK